MIADGNVMGAFLLDVREIQRKFPGKYDAGIAQATAYARCLQAHSLLR